MDSSNKQNLTPELKEIYDRVMNTAAKPITPQPAASTPSALKPSEAAVSPPAVSRPEAVPHAAPAATPEPVVDNPPSQDATTQAGGAAVGESNEFLSSVSPRPLQDIGVKAFSFSGKKVTATTADEATPAATPAAKKGGISKPILITLIGVFIVIWSVTWAIFLGLIKLGA